jgi:hypothetical protein
MPKLENKWNGRRKPFRLPAAEWRYTRALLLPATLLAMLMMTTMMLTTGRSSEDLLTLGLHFPLFLLISLVGAGSVAHKWRGLLYLAIPLVLAEWILLLVSSRVP